MKIYIFALIVAAIVAAGAYWSGGRVGAEKCRAEIANQAAATQVATQNEIIETKRSINAETFNTGLSDIRDRLRAHYTIKS